jgi:hypothetical protein
MNNRYSKSNFTAENDETDAKVWTGNDNLTHLMLTPEDRVRVRRYGSKENFLPVYDDRIEEDKDEDNYTSNFDSPGQQKRQKVSIIILPGVVLESIMEYFGNSTFMYLLCKGVFHKILYCKIDIHETQQEMLTNKLQEFKSVLQNMKIRDIF